MLSLNTAMSFLGISLLLAAAPGPEIIFILTQSLAYGRKVGLIVALGNVGALLIPTFATALGLGTLMAASPVAYDALRYVGAAYLAYLGIKALVNLIKQQEALELTMEDAPTGSLALRGAILCLTNPQTMTLFLAFMPQFINVDGGSVGGQVVSLGLINMVATYAIFAVVAWASGFVRHQIAAYPSVLRGIDGVTAVVLLGLAVRLVLS